MKRAARIAFILLSLSSVAPAHGKGDATHWPQYAEDESLASVAPMGRWIAQPR